MLYNWDRDYNPALGRYVQSDPIGLGGGISTYGYVYGNPNVYVDPTGNAGIAGPAAAACLRNPECALGALLIGGTTIAVSPKPTISSSYDPSVNGIPSGVNASTPPAAAANAPVCTPARPPKDPCKGFRKNVSDHEQKLNDYLNNPLGSDNKGLLSNALLAQDGAQAGLVYEGRVSDLKDQIDYWKWRVQRCEAGDMSPKGSHR